MSANSFTGLAREAIKEFFEKKEIIAPPAPLPVEMNTARGVFVTLKNGNTLRGCIGTILPTQPNVASEIIFNAISAATRDPRYSPVKAEDLANLEIIVDVLTEPVQLFELADHNYQTQGVIVQQDDKRGLVLPGALEVNSVEQQLELGRERAGITPESTVDVYHFNVTRYQG